LAPYEASKPKIDDAEPLQLPDTQHLQASSSQVKLCLL
jgi:hypothetical protein